MRANRRKGSNLTCARLNEAFGFVSTGRNTVGVTHSKSRLRPISLSTRLGGNKAECIIQFGGSWGPGAKEMRVVSIWSDIHVKET